MKQLVAGFRALVAVVAFFKAGPGGQPLVTHHHLHKE
jgi:hypothetical protein